MSDAGVQRRRNPIPFEGAELHTKHMKILTTPPTEFKGHAFVQVITPDIQVLHFTPTVLIYIERRLALLDDIIFLVVIAWVARNLWQ